MPLLMCGIAICSAQQKPEGLPPGTLAPEDLLSSLRHKLMDTIGRLPRYMCTQSVERYRYESKKPSDAECGPSRNAETRSTKAKLRLVSSDRLRLDVAVGATREIYSWPGENHFDDRGLFDLIRDGAISTGGFAGFVTAIFGRDAATFTYEGDVTEAGRRLVQFGFRVPREKSNYEFVAGTYRALAGYAGTFQVDPGTLDLVRLVVRAAPLSPESGACEADSTLDYARVRLNNQEFLLPAANRLDIFHPDGSEDENLTTYSACHEFSAESTISFDSPAKASVSDRTRANSASLPEIPGGLPFQLTFTQDVDSATAAGGDRISAILSAAIQDHGKVFARRGAAVSARIIRLEHVTGPPPWLALIIRIGSVDTYAGARPVRATADLTANRFLRPDGDLRQAVELGDSKSLDFPDMGVFTFWNANEKYIVHKGTITRWRTASR